MKSLIIEHQMRTPAVASLAATLLVTWLCWRGEFAVVRAHDLRGGVDPSMGGDVDPDDLPLKMTSPELVANFPLAVTSQRHPWTTPKKHDEVVYCDYEYTCGTRVAPGATTADVSGFRCYCYGKRVDEKNQCFVGRCYDERWSQPRSDKDLDTNGLCEAIFSLGHRTDETFCNRQNEDGEHFFTDPPNSMPRL